jgi:K+-sensing histidine kinase KdpD
VGAQKKKSANSISYSVTGLDLLRTVGNELKLPLMHISNAASLLKDEDFSVEERNEQYEQLELSSRRMLQIIDSVLFAGQIETQQTSLNLEPTNVAAIVHSVIVECRELAFRYNKEVSLRISQEVAPAAVDPTALRHSLYGLLDMLIRSAESDRVTILVHHQSDSIMITMRDNGPAISMKQIQSAFRHLGKAARPVKQLPSTTGMAFYVAYSLSRAMGGDLSITQSGEQRRLSIKMPLSQQLELI